jgi:hypothetical protein
MVHMSDSFRDQWPAWALLGFGLLFATAGAGRYALDHLLEGRTRDDRDKAEAAAAR